MKKNIVIVHYNTPHLTECLVRSINLFVNDAVIYIFDNSDRLPFTAEFDNVTVLDNTKGEIIDFNKWLSGYKNRVKSHGRVNGWGSAKHCYSVEKCMEILQEAFILLDSDVLLKKDISYLFKDDIIFSGEIITQPNSSIKRVLPFITYINTKMCIENDVHYFDDNYMHGLYKDINSDRYDTGANFYRECSKYKYEEIKYSDYILHYGHGSWNKTNEKKSINPKEWLNANKRFWGKEKNKKVVYTCITSGYDSLLDPKYITEGFDYVCFTDDVELKSDIWITKPLPRETDELPQSKKQRFVKINPHLFLKDYDISIWVDGNVSLNGDLNEFISSNLNDNTSIYVPKHPSRNCIYKEAKAVISMKKDKKENVDPQIERYKEEGFPEDYGLLQSNILLRKHNNDDCIKLMEDWSNEVINNSHRDQLSFNYALWKNDRINIVYLDKLIYKSKYFYWNGGHKHTSQKKIPSKNRIEELKTEFKSINFDRRKVSTYKVPIYY